MATERTAVFATSTLVSFFTLAGCSLVEEVLAADKASTSGTGYELNINWHTMRFTSRSIMVKTFTFWFMTFGLRLMTSRITCN